MPTLTPPLHDIPRFEAEEVSADSPRWRASRFAPLLPRSATTRLVATLLLAALAAVALLHYRGWSAVQAELAAAARAQGLAGTELSELVVRLRREGDPTAARLVLAARLFDLEIASREPGSPASAERLLATRELARQALREEPASWQAAMLLGAAVSLERARTRDPRLYSLARDCGRSESGCSRSRVLSEVA